MEPAKGSRQRSGFGPCDYSTPERIREPKPGSPVLTKPVYLEHLAEAIAEIVN